jgi:phage-related protein/predicted XRE-type DNA-binding protein
MKLLKFVADSLKCLRGFPKEARQDAGYQLDKVQKGEQPDDFKPMPTIGAGVEELRVRDESGIYRVIYTARLADAVYVLHAFEKENAGHSQKRYRLGTQKAVGYFEGCKAMSDIETFENAWNALADTPEEAANLRARAELIRQIAAMIKAGGWTQVDAAARCGVTQPRINDLLRGRVSRFSLDALVNIATHLGKRVSVVMEAA